MDLQQKQQIFQQVLAKMEESLSVLVESAFEAKEASTNEESKAENKYDTRGLEASYLASGQAQRAQKLQEQIFNLKKVELKSYGSTDPIGISAFLQLEIDEGDSLLVFLLPAGGIELEYKNQKLRTLTLDSPLGQQVFGQTEGFDFILNGKEFFVAKVY